MNSHVQLTPRREQADVKRASNRLILVCHKSFGMKVSINA